MITLGLSIFSGIVGAGTRIGVQLWSYRNTEEQPHDSIQGYLVAIGLGAVGGWISWELPNYISEWSYGRLGAFAVGYLFPDIVENIVYGFKPPVGE